MLPKLLPAIFLMFCLFFSANTFSQTPTGTIKGKVINAEGKPAAGVNVRLKHTKKATSTDHNGFFELKNLPAVNDSLILSHIGSKELSLLVSVEKGGTTDIGTVKLNNKIKELEGIEVNGRLISSYKSDYSFFGDKTQTATIDIPQAISTVTKELIQDKMELTLKDAMNDVAGVNQYSGYDEYTIRGFRAENSRDIDGLRGYNTTYASPLLVNVERIEVIKGPTATLYGNCDPGGTINLVTKKPLDKNEAEINLYQGSWDHYRAQGDVTGPLNSSKTLLYRFNAGYDNTNSFRDNYYAKSYQLAPSFSFIPNDRLSVNVNFSFSHINTVLDRGQPGFQGDSTLKSTPTSLSVIQKGDYLHETDFASTITASYKITDNLSFNTGYLNYITRQGVANHAINDYITPNSVNLSYTTWSYNTSTNTLTNYFTYKAKTGGISHQLLLGYDYIHSSLKLNQKYFELPGEFGDGSGIVGTFSLKNPQFVNRPVSSYQEADFDADETDVDADVYHTQGIYLQDQLSFGKWIVLGSLREEYYKADDGTGLNENVFLPRLGVVYALQPNIKAYATYNKGFDPSEVSPNAQLFNEKFIPIISETLEAGVKGNFFTNKLSASLALYQLTVNNVPVNANDPSKPDLFVQQGQNRSRGIEAEAAGNILSNLSANLYYTYSVAKVTKSKVPDELGTIVENAPRNTSGSWIKYTFDKGALKGFGVSAGHTAVSSRNTLDPSIVLPGYVVLNGGVHYKYSHYMLGLNVYNITDKTYWAGAYNNINKWPGAPRNYIVNLGYAF